MITNNRGTPQDWVQDGIYMAGSVHVAFVFAFMFVRMALAMFTFMFAFTFMFMAVVEEEVLQLGHGDRREPRVGDEVGRHLDAWHIWEKGVGGPKAREHAHAIVI